MGGLGRPLGAPLRGPLPLHLNSNALSGGHRATLRTLPSRADRRHSVEVVAFGGDPYEPLEKAINVSKTHNLIWLDFLSSHERSPSF
jgi:hypothetical protein